MQTIGCISTKFLPATNFRGDRIKASGQGVSLTIPYNYSLDAAPNHRAAAVALARKLDLLDDYDLMTAELPSRDGYCHILYAVLKNNAPSNKKEAIS